MKIISHRGKYSKKSHENSIKTILRTDKLLPKYIEIDIQQNYQGDLILSHDLVADMNHQEQKQLPRLIDLLNNSLKSTLLIEIKQPGISKKILALINKKGATWRQLPKEELQLRCRQVQTIRSHLFFPKVRCRKKRLMLLLLWCS